MTPTRRTDDTADDSGGGAAPSVPGDSDSAPEEGPVPDGGRATDDSEVRVLATVGGYDLVLERDLIAFPWRAGLKRAPVAFAATFVVVFLLAAVGGFGSGPLVDRFSLLGLLVYQFHHVQAATGTTPGAVEPVATAVGGVPVLGRALRGLFVTGFDHADPTHLVDIVAGKQATVGHVDLVSRSTGDIPVPVYYAVPPLVLVAAGFEFASTNWDRAVVESPLEVVRFGAAIGAGYLLVLLVGTVLLTVEMTSPLTTQTFVVHPDRYMTLLFGFVYPAFWATVGAGIVYLARGSD